MNIYSHSKENLLHTNVYKGEVYTHKSILKGFCFCFYCKQEAEEAVPSPVAPYNPIFGIIMNLSAYKMDIGDYSIYEDDYIVIFIIPFGHKWL